MTYHSRCNHQWMRAYIYCPRCDPWIYLIYIWTDGCIDRADYTYDRIGIYIMVSLYICDDQDISSSGIYHCTYPSMDTIFDSRRCFCYDGISIQNAFHRYAGICFFSKLGFFDWYICMDRGVRRNSIGYLDRICEYIYAQISSCFS
jgi:hypothetical protein